MNTAQWRSIYRKALFCVNDGNGEIILRYGPSTPERTRALIKLGVRRRWAIVTPCNPHSKMLSDQANDARLQKFFAELDAAGWRLHASLNRDEQGRWPDEPGALLCDVPLKTTRALSSRYGQNAFLTAALGKAAYLCWTG